MLLDAIIALAAAMQADKPVDIRFCPPAAVRSYALDDARDVHSVLLHNASIVNRSGARVDLTSVAIQLLQASVVVDERRLTAGDLQRAAVAGKRLQDSGALKAYAFQFCGTSLIADGVTLAGAGLEAGQALLLTQQTFAVNGLRDTLRLVVRGKTDNADFEAAAALPIDRSFALSKYRFPLIGTWLVTSGPSLHTHHRWATMEEFALDIAKIDQDGATGKSPRQKWTDFYAYGSDVVAASGGEVVAVVDGQPEDATALRRPSEDAEAYLQRIIQGQSARLAAGANATTGNLVTIAHGQNEYSHYMHLKPGSVRVHVGQRVTTGQVLAKLGSSGNSTEPHLHFQVCDGPSPLTCAGIPVSFEGITLPLADLPRPLQSGDLVRTQK